jgi:hypothetical protein
VSLSASLSAEHRASLVSLSGLARRFQILGVMAVCVAGTTLNA